MKSQLHTRWAGLVFGAALLLLTAGCFGEGDVIGARTAQGGEDEVNRKCDEILGTAFVSAEERQWFLDNCSSWPATKLPQTAAVREPAECAQIRGRPYESDQQRTWFLQNCTTGLSSQTAGAQGDRSNCDEIRGTPYRSDGERAWYLANCLVTFGPDRTNCDEIRGTQYRSATEGEWYRSNCLVAAPAVRTNTDQGQNHGNGNGRDRRGGRGND